MAGFKSVIGHMNREQLTAAVIQTLAVEAGSTGTTIAIVDAGHFVLADVDRVKTVLKRLSNPAYAARAARGVYTKPKVQHG